MQKCEVKVVRQRNEITVELTDEDGSIFTTKVTDREPDAYSMYLGENTAVTVEGPIKVGGEYVERMEVVFSLADEISVEPSSGLKYLRLQSGTLVLRQSVFITVDGGKREITTDQMAVD